jgi:hypothetical protein
MSMQKQLRLSSPSRVEKTGVRAAAASAAVISQSSGSAG